MTDEKTHERMLAWAWWRKAGPQADGHPSTNILHPSWMPPAKGRTPSMRTAPRGDDRQQREVERAVAMLSRRLHDAIVEHYLHGGQVQAQAQRLGCAVSTLHARLQMARASVRGYLEGARESSTAGVL